MTELTQGALDYIGSNPSLGVAAAFLIAMGEALLIIGLFVPSTATLIAIVAPAVAGLVSPKVAAIVTYARLPVAALLMMCVFAVLYWILPDVKQPFRFITPGSVVAVIIWALVSWGFSVYVRNFGKYDATYGALGGVIVLLLWMWISAQAVLLGAEINAVLYRAALDEGGERGAGQLARDAARLRLAHQDRDGAGQPLGQPSSDPAEAQDAVRDHDGTT